MTSNSTTPAPQAALAVHRRTPVMLMRKFH
jgi:hypothetical protein